MVTTSLLLLTLPSLRTLAQPAHDRFEERRVLEGAAISFSDSNIGGTTEPGEPNHSGEPNRSASASLWYTWRAPAAGLVLIDLAGSSFDTALGLYEGKRIPDLRTLARNDNRDDQLRTSRLLAPVESGADYQIAVAGVQGQTGRINFQLRMVNAPEIVSDPADVSATYGETVGFQARVMGVPPLRYRWLHNGLPIPDRSGETPSLETTLTLSLNDITDAHDGAYSIEVSNDRGTSESRRARLAVGLAPKIIRQPSSVAASDGQDVTFDVQVVGKPPLEYRWRKNNTEIPNAAQADLVLPNVQPTSAGSFRVVIQNAWGSATSTAAELTVSGQSPSLLSQPQGVTNIVGSRIQLAVTAGGSRPLSFQWSKDGTPLAGQTRTDLVLESAQLSDTGEYSVRVTNARGQATSLPARIRILVPPPNDPFANAFAITRTNYPVLETGYNVGATREPFEPNHDGSAAAQSVWWKWRSPARGLATVEFTNTTFEPRLGVYTGAALPELIEVPYRTPFVVRTLSWLTDPDTEYSLGIDRADAAAGDLNFRLRFTTNLLGPLILRPPVAKVVPACEEIVLEVVATNQPTNLRYPLSYQWQFEGTDIPGATGPTFRVPNAQRSHAGLYSVRVSNYGGSTTSLPIRCDVEEGPRFTIQPSDLDLLLCQDAQLRALGSGCEPIHYQWFFQDAPISRATNRVLPLPNIDLSNGGSYFVVMQNPDGLRTSRVARVRIDPSPRILSDSLNHATVRECSNHSFQVAAETTCRPLSYQWFHNRTNPIPEATTPRLQLSNVQTNHAGDYSVVIRNLYAATTSRVARLTVSALPLIPSNQPEDRRRVRLGDSFDIHVAPDSCTPMTYRWLFNGSPNLPGTSLLVSVTNITPTATNVTLVPMLAGTNTAQLVFTQPSTNLSGRYRVEVRNSAGLAVSRDATIEILEPPINDHFRNRLPLLGTNVLTSGHDIIATREPEEPTHIDGQRWDRSIWWTWTAPPDDGYLTVDLAGSTYDTLLAVYSGDTLRSLRRLASDDNGGGNNTSRITGLAVLSDSTVQIAIDGKGNAEGATRLRLVFNADTNPPSFTLHPKSVAVLPGGTARFEIDVARTPRVQFQWQLNGVNLPGQTNRILVLPNVQRTDEGPVVCLARNKYGTTTSRIGWLTTGAIVQGQVTDATNKRPIPFARVSVGEGPTAVSTLTDTNGNYELVGARPGTLRADFDADRRVVGLLDDVEFMNQSTLDAAMLACTATNYYRYEDRHYVVTPGGIVTNSFSLSPILLGGLRFVLNWGIDPADLDLHVRTPRIQGTAYEIDYRNRFTHSGDNPPYGQLDADEQRSYGPETITFHRFVAGTYQVFVQKFDPSARGELTGSSAQVRVYDNQGLLRTIDVPTAGTGRFWHVLDVDGATREIRVVNRITPALPTAAPTATPGVSPLADAGSREAARPAHSRNALQSPSRANYVWSFGDGRSTPSTLDRVPHRYPKPGLFTVSLAMSSVVNGTPTNTITVRTNFILVTNDPPRVRITSPLSRTVLRLGSPQRVTATATDSDGDIRQVRFLANGKPIGSSSTAPHEIDWTPTTEEIVSLVAEATDNHGATGLSEPVLVSTRDLWGDVLIVRNAIDPEIERMKSLCEEIRCINNQPLTVRILDRDELTFDLMKTFRLIIWNHLAPTNPPLRHTEIELFRRCYEFGIPFYLLGEDLATMGSRLDTTTRTAWNTFAHLAPDTTITKIGPGLVDNTAPGGSHDILFSAYAEFAPFRYDGNLETSRADGAVDVVLATADVPLLVAFPSVHATTGTTRQVTQNFRIESPGSGSAAETQLQQLFQSAVSWLIQCPSCPELDLQLHRLLADPASPHTGEPFNLEIQLRHSGACDPTGVSVKTELPADVELLASHPSRPVRDGRDVIFRLGRLPNGFATNLTLTLKASSPAKLRFLVCASANGPDNYSQDNCKALDLEPTPSTNRQPPRLEISRQPSGLRVDVLGASGVTYLLEESFDLKVWSPAQATAQPSSQGAFFLVPATPASRTYRVRVL